MLTVSFAPAESLKVTSSPSTNTTGPPLFQFAVVLMSQAVLMAPVHVRFAADAGSATRISPTNAATVVFMRCFLPDRRAAALQWPAPQKLIGDFAERWTVRFALRNCANAYGVLYERPPNAAMCAPSW